MRTRAVLIGLALSLVGIAAIAGMSGCGDGTADAPIDADPTPAESCVRPGDVGNNTGVGQYCTPSGSECASFDLAPLCLAAVGQDQWFCTRIGCDATTNCGDGAGCLVESQGSACVPCRCDARGIGCQ